MIFAPSSSRAVASSNFNARKSASAARTSSSRRRSSAAVARVASDGGNRRATLSGLIVTSDAHENARSDLRLQRRAALGQADQHAGRGGGGGAARCGLPHQRHHRRRRRRGSLPRRLAPARRQQGHRQGRKAAHRRSGAGKTWTRTRSRYGIMGSTHRFARNFCARDRRPRESIALAARVPRADGAAALASILLLLEA